MAKIQCTKIFAWNGAVTRENLKKTPRIPSNSLITGSGFPGEFEALCLVAQTKADYDAIATVLKGDIDWAVLLNLAEAHSVRLQLIHALQKLDWDGVPREIKRSLSDFMLLHKAHNLLVAGELIRLNEKLSQSAIRFATFKGPSLAASLYGDLSLRECNDIDLIVDEDQVVKAEGVLGSLGYRSPIGSSMFRNAFLSYQKQFLFVREDNSSLAIDLHWDFAGTSVPFPITSAVIWQNLEEVDIGGHLVPTLGRADLALFLVGHGAKEGWRYLGWLADFALYIEKHPDLDWTNLLARARRRGCSRSLLVAWLLAARLLGSRVDANFLRLAESNTQARLTAEALVYRIRNEYPMAASGRELSELELCENRLQRARAIGSFLITRTIGDYISMPLPRPLWRIYHLTRPFRLTGKVIINSGSIKKIRKRMLSRVYFSHAQSRKGCL
jgi:hypothetical protein